MGCSSSPQSCCCILCIPGFWEGEGTETPSPDGQGSCCSLKVGSHQIPTGCLVLLKFAPIKNDPELETHPLPCSFYWNNSSQCFSVLHKPPLRWFLWSALETAAELPQDSHGAHLGSSQHQDPE